MGDRPIGFANYYTNSSRNGEFPSGDQQPYEYYQMNRVQGYSEGYGVADTTAVAEKRGIPSAEAYPLHLQQPLPPAHSIPAVDSTSSIQETHIPPAIHCNPNVQDNGASHSIIHIDSPRGSKASEKRLLREQSDNDREPADDEYDQLFFGNCGEKRKRIDFILAYQKEEGADKRKRFEENLAKDLELERENDGPIKFVKVHAPMKFLYKEAERMQMKMPVKKNDLAESDSFLSKLYKDIIDCRNPFLLDTKDIEEEENYFTHPFRFSEKHKFHDVDSPNFFTSAQRSVLVKRKLMNCQYGTDTMQIGINQMISEGYYSAAYPLHEVKHEISRKPASDRQRLNCYWVGKRNLYKEQPLDLIRKYFGEKIGLYFSWLGLYTVMLIPPAIVGIISIIYGLLTVSNYVTVKEICSNSTHFLMCPRCDFMCPYWSLVDSCLYSQIAYILDNPFTVVFAIFMSFWATCFLEVWKRKQAEISYDWDLIGFEDEEEQPRVEYENKLKSKADKYRRSNPITEKEEFYIHWRKKISKYASSLCTVAFMISLVIAALLGVIVYRVAVSASLAKSRTFDISWIGLFASFTAAGINLVCIMLLNLVYEWIALFLTRRELPRTQSDFDDSYTFKMYLFQFVNFYGSLFYIAFFKLDPGHPGRYNTIFGYRREECNPAGCLFELGVQLFVIMVGKQIVNSIFELLKPKAQSWLEKAKNRWRMYKKKKDQNGGMEEKYQVGKRPSGAEKRWEKDYELAEVPDQGLFDEYLEMVIQFGFITLFVAAFPLGPFFALLNNMIEIRADAYKFVVLYRRPVAQKVQDIGIWYPILDSVVKLSVVVNAFVIAFVSEFVQRLYYSHAVQQDGTLTGFIADSLSCFDVRDSPTGEGPPVSYNFSNNLARCSDGLPYCRYRGYYEPPYIELNDSQLAKNPRAYTFRTEHWHIIAAKLFFVIAFEHLVFFLTGFLAWIIPDVPQKLQNQIKKEAYLARDAFISEGTYDEQNQMKKEEYLDGDEFISKGAYDENTML